jgi:murein DD-endopeptidase MepM/ murein hydrolase activator NlpD
MANGRPFSWLPNNPNFVLSKSRLAFRIALGVFFLTFFLDYQPVFSWPPLRQNRAYAQVEQTQTVTPQALPFTFQIPHPGYMSTPFSNYHPGIDIATGLGMPIKPIAPGTIIDEGFNFWGLGLNVTVQHSNGYQSIYAHMGKIYVTKGQKVSETDILGEVGMTGHTTGPHTHLEVSKDGAKIDPKLILPELRLQPVLADFTPTVVIPTVKKEPKLPKLDLKVAIKNSL